MYSNHNYVKSGLITGTQWDMMLKYMQDTGNVDNLDYNMNATFNSYVLRGGAFSDVSSAFPVTYRSYGNAPRTPTYCGFRLTLYLQ